MNLGQQPEFLMKEQSAMDKLLVASVPIILISVPIGISYGSYMLVKYISGGRGWLSIGAGILPIILIIYLAEFA